MAVQIERELAGLLVASRLWAARRPVDEERVRRARAEALLANHRRYLASVPAYARLAVELGHTEVDSVSTLVDELAVGVGLFKSYDDELIRRGDFAGLTSWVGEVSTLDPAVDLTGVTSVAQWRAAMAEAGVWIMMSSGTSGRPSFIPRDQATMTALRTNGRCYSTIDWDGYGEGAADFDCLLVTPPGDALGIQSVAIGLTQLARHTLGLDPDEGVRPLAARVASAGDLVADAMRQRRRVLLFGTPAAVARLCTTMLAEGLRLPLPGDAMLVTGGGWKGVTRPSDFAALLASALALSPEQTVDIYGMAECNAYLIRCPSGTYHVPPVLEAAVLGDDLRALPGSDATGLIALLDPFAFSYPGFLITGDWGRLVEDGCACGLAGPGFVGEIVRAPGREAKGCAGVGTGVMA